MWKEAEQNAHISRPRKQDQPKEELSMKRTLSLLLALTLLYALLTACGIQPSGSTSKPIGSLRFGCAATNDCW